MDNTKNNAPRQLPITTTVVGKDGNIGTLKEIFKALKDAGFGDTPTRVSIAVVDLNPK